MMQIIWSLSIQVMDCSATRTLSSGTMDCYPWPRDGPHWGWGSQSSAMGLSAESMAGKIGNEGYSAFPRSPKLELHHQMYFGITPWKCFTSGSYLSSEYSNHHWQGSKHKITCLSCTLKLNFGNFIHLQNLSK